MIFIEPVWLDDLKASDGLTKYDTSDRGIKYIHNNTSLVLEMCFKIGNKIAGQEQSSLKSIGIPTVFRCISGPDVKILTCTYGDLSHGQPMLTYHE